MPSQILRSILWQNKCRQQMQIPRHKQEGQGEETVSLYFVEQHGDLEWISAYPFIRLPVSKCTFLTSGVMFIYCGTLRWKLHFISLTWKQRVVVATLWKRIPLFDRFCLEQIVGPWLVFLKDAQNYNLSQWLQNSQVLQVYRSGLLNIPVIQKNMRQKWCVSAKMQ